MIERKRYLEKLKRNRWNGDVKVISGLRRVGKSVLLFDLFHDFLIEEGVKEDHIIKIELDKRRYLRFRNPVYLCDYVENVLSSSPKENFYLFIDEVQLSLKIKDEETGIEITIYDMLNELKGYPNLDVYVTGSNSKGLSSDIATEFRGRGTIIEVFPLSYAEFSLSKEGSEEEKLEEYLRYGGMPKVLSYQDPSDKRQYLDSLYNRIYIKDIKERAPLLDEEIIGPILDFLASEIGTTTNPNNIANAIASRRKEASNRKGVFDYIELFKDAFLIKEAKRYDVKGKKYFDFPLKYYFTDLGLRNSRLNYRQYDPGHLMENLIFNELLSRGYSVDVGVMIDGDRKQSEVDFVVNDGSRKSFIQSCYRLDEGKRGELEIAPLLNGVDYFRRVIIRHDISESYFDDNGLFHLSLFDFLYGRKDVF